jgi:hypothetical protein
MSEPASQRRRAFLSATPRPSLLAGLASLLFFSLVLAVAARADNSAARPPASVAPKEAVLAPAKGTAPADPADLGRGLRFLQLAAGTSDSAFAAALDSPALVLDLRLAPAEPAVEARLRELLARATAARPLFILLGRETPGTLRATIPPAAPGLLTMAAKDSGIAAGVLIAADTERDRAAAESLAAGKPPRELVEERIEKARYDEARLARDHANGRREREEPEPVPEADPAAKPEKSAAPAEPPLQDLLLQRAVFIHRGLLALGRIPEHT